MNRVLTALTCLLVASAASGQLQSSDAKVFVKRAVIEDGTLVLDLKIDPGWHIYAVNFTGTVGAPTKVTVDKPFEVAGAVVETKPKYHKEDHRDEQTNEIYYTEEYHSHEGEITFRVPLRGPATGVLRGKVDVTACDADKCLPPGEVRFTAHAGGANGDAAPAADAAASEEAPESRDGIKRISNPSPSGKLAEKATFRVVEISYPERIASERFDLRIVAEVSESYHIYGFERESGFPTEVRIETVSADAPVVVAVDGEVTADPAPKHRKKKFEDYHYFEGGVTFTVPVRAGWAGGKPPARADADVSFPLRVVIDYQACTMDFCLPVATVTYDLLGVAVSGSSGLPVTGVVMASPGKTSRSAFVVTITSEPATLEPGDVGTLVAHMRRLDGGKIEASSAKPRFDLAQAQNVFADGDATAKFAPDGSSVTFRLPVRVAAEATEGDVVITGKTSIGPASGPFEGTVHVKAPLIGFLITAALAALFALLTPCVFPMIPVTISFFTKQAERARAHPARLGVVYCLGIIASFTAIGGAFSAMLTAQDANAFAGHWITQVVIGALFIFFALSLLGMFDLAVPQPIMRLVERSTTRRMEAVSQGKGVLFAILLMGLLFSITTFTCTAPFIGGLLATASSTGQFTRPIIGMLTFSAVLAIPFFFLAVFPSQMKKLPKAGGWLNETKVVMGFVELAAAIKFISTADLQLGWGIFTRDVCLSIWVVLFGLTGLYLLGVFRLPKDMPREKTSVIALLLSILFLTGAICFTTGLNDRPLGKWVEGWLPPIHREVKTEGDRRGLEGRFIDDLDGAIAEAERLGAPLFIDFTGFSCANCRTVENDVFAKSTDVQDILRTFVVVELHLDAADASLRERNNEYFRQITPNQSGMPTYAVVDPRNLVPLSNWGWLKADREEWVKVLRDAVDRWKSRDVSRG